MPNNSFWPHLFTTFHNLFQLSLEDGLKLLLLIIHEAFLISLLALFLRYLFLRYRFAIKRQKNQAKNIIMALHDRKGWIYLHARQGSPLDGILLHSIPIQSDLSDLLEKLSASDKIEEEE